MLDGNDLGTFYSLRLLRDEIDRNCKPLLLWMGAGVSMWCGYPSWNETAERMLGEFSKLEKSFDRVEGRALLEQSKFPALFEMFRQTNRQRYNRALVSTFGSRAATPVYSRFIKIVESIRPTRVLTTNVDETFEKNAPWVEVVQSSDLGRCVELLEGKTSFLAKLHGSISAVETTVFSDTDYQRLVSQEGYREVLQTLLMQSMVLFVGYSLRDEYVLNLLTKNMAVQNLFGDGPHFLIQPGGSTQLPDSVHLIRYSPDPYADHRSAITALDIIRVVKNQGHVWFTAEDDSPQGKEEFKSSYFLTDVIPIGTWTTSNSLTLQNGFNAIIGQGFVETEVESPRLLPAMHDITVGLLAFDELYIPLACLSRIHDLLGSQVFWQLVHSGILRFIHLNNEPVVMFQNVEAASGGDIGLLRIDANPDGTPFTIESEIQRQIKAYPGYEKQVDVWLQNLAKSAVQFDYEKFNIPSLTRGALLHPSIQQLLGISDAVLPTSFPRWNRFPILRLAHTIIAGCVCENLRMPATKLSFGGEILVGAAFAVSAAKDWADDVTSYVLTGRFNTDLGSYVQENPHVIPSILKFRDTNAGTQLRREIAQQLATHSGAEFVASVNGGLRQILPPNVMDQARDQLSGLLFARKTDSPLVPAVWTNTRNSDAVTRLWRKRSHEELSEYCRKRGIKQRSYCPCGSNEKLRDCCERALVF